MIDAIGLLVGVFLGLFRTRRSLLLENLALRQQLAAFKRRHPRPRLATLAKLGFARKRISEYDGSTRQNVFCYDSSLAVATNHICSNKPSKTSTTSFGKRPAAPLSSITPSRRPGFCS